MVNPALQLRAPGPLTIPVLCHTPLSPAEAGSVWRTEKLREFAFKARALSMQDDPEIAALLAKATEHTAVLEALATAQAEPAYERPWWQDGEYDNARADR